MKTKVLGLCAASLLICAAPVATFAQPVAPTPPPHVRESIYVPVRDGTKLAVNIYRPAENGRAATGKRPVIFVFTPYRARYRETDGKVVEAALNDQLALASLIRAGYVVAVADIRGKGASFGHRRGFQDRTEARDGYDLVEWLARRPFSDGKVGMIGCSYLGGTTFHTASTAPPSLKAVFIGASDLDKYDFVRAGGITAQFNTRPDEPPSVDLASLPVDGDEEGTQLRAAVAEHAANTPMAPLWYGMPNRDSVSPLTGNAFWQEAGVYAYMDAIKRAGIATYFWGNLKDEPTGQTLFGATNLGSKFLAGPGSHCVPPQGFDFTGEVVRYFDHYLKGVDNGIDREPRATYWLEGSNGYVRSDQLPGVESRPLPWFLTGGKAGRQLGAAPGVAGTAAFTVDYKLPPAEYFGFWPQPMDKHGLSFTSRPVTAPMTLVGFPVAHLTVTSTSPDADLFVYLDQIDAKGKAEVISFGRLKLSHRKLAEAPYKNFGLPWHSGLTKDLLPLAPGEKAAVSMTLTPVSRIVPAGARLRFTIAGADPRQRNLKDIQITPPPRIGVLHGGRDPSRIELPLAR
ncbi:CocE/NonD family hydrolase [Sphingomonas piscis]|uniref:CocE/NonD family hydrolase n=1 Tax=Sphingomonas piscis TaxID=2714943 RepID=A0A6G7YM47_9SPHN|nr:CocE/NonD family hydrolase [Sphingomonas piscis]QIK77811.1 CocE/NonD family hydrolase [Sphingomonas piscis]